MKSWNTAGKVRLALAAALLITAGVSQSWGAAQNTPGEGKCQTAMTKAIGKHATAVTKAMATCKNAVIAAGMGTCPDTAALEAIAKSAAKAAKSASKKCQSKCSLSGVSCIGNPFCPPNGATTENCTDAGKNVFRSTSMNFPGPYCVSIIGHKMTEPEDFGECAGGLGEIMSDEMMDNIYGDLAAPPSPGAQACLDAIAKALPKAASKVASTVAKCRSTQLTAESAALLPDNCPTDDTKTADGIDKARQKLLDAIAGDCDDTTIDELSLCGTGIGGTDLVTEAQDCLSDVLDQVAFSTDDAETRAYAAKSIINGAYPDTAAARCGDDLINQQANQFLLNGEECDGTDLGDCASCVAPGDMFECTCAETRRTRVFADGFAADLDNGWTGASHNAKVTDGAGFVSEVANCNCSAFTGATCTGATSDPVCDVSAELKPRCSHRIGDGTSCDQVGNTNGVHKDDDCHACSDGAANEGDFCTGEARFCVGGASTGNRCNQPSDCPGGACDGIGACLNGPFAGNGCAGPQHCGVCLGGLNIGLACSTNGNCPGSTCEAHSCATSSCLGGTNDEGACATNTDCPGAGARCAETSDCNSQCYDENDVAQGDCWSQADCDAIGPDLRCRGVCDASNTCVKIRNGAPLPLSSEGTSVCIDSQFFTNMTGTRNIVTGEHAINYDLRSVTILADELNSSPCPVCGGWCAITGSALDQFRCSGSCTGGLGEKECRYGENIGMSCTTNADCGDNLCAAVACRFDSDCPTGTCDGASSPDCLGGDCRLDLACSLGPNEGLPCRIEAATAFGTTSADCPPSPGSNVSGGGLAISWTPLTSGVITAENPGACDAPGYQHYDCNCVTGAGTTRNQPNRCLPACNAPGPDFGRKCASFTTCVGGTDAGEACDEDPDCAGGGVCTGNPRVCGTGNTGVCSVQHCVGGTNNGLPCASVAQCPGGGVCTPESCTVGGPACLDGACNPDNCATNADCEPLVTCDDVCPSGLCTPLCTQIGICSGGLEDGLKCALDIDCTGGGTCVPGDPQEGACAQGTFNHCDGPGWEFVSCAPLQVGTKEGCEYGTDNIQGNPNDNIGAGYCVADVTNCFINDAAGEGGSTLNGNGDPTNSYSVASFCIPASTNPAVNSTAGLPGPGRIRQPAVVVPNFAVLP